MNGMDMLSKLLDLFSAHSMPIAFESKAAELLNLSCPKGIDLLTFWLSHFLFL